MSMFVCARNVSIFAASPAESVCKHHRVMGAGFSELAAALNEDLLVSSGVDGKLREVVRDSLVIRE